MEKLNLNEYEEWAKKMEERFGTYEKPEPIDERKVNQEKMLKETDLFERIKKQTFENFQIHEAETEEALLICKEFVKNKNRKALLLCGKTSTGKTHLATAVCRELINKRIMVREVKYLKMVNDLKALTLDFEDRNHELKKYRTPQVLYIDDLFKGNVTTAELKIVFEVIDYRYCNNKVTIITTEKNLDELNAIANGEAESIKSRLLEMTNGFFCEFKNAPNFRDTVSYSKKQDILKRIHGNTNV